MTDYKKDMYAKISPATIDDLKTLYEDYLFMARVHEQSILLTTDAELAMEQMGDMYSPNEDYPWHIKPATAEEAKEFAEFAANNIGGSGKSTYISLKHIRDEEDNVKPPVYVSHPYTSMTLGMHMPSMVERFKVCFPENATLGNTEFNIDGRYKAVYTNKKNKDKLLSESLNDSDLQTQIVIMINMSEHFRHNGYVVDENFEKNSMIAYAEEKIAINENNLIEIISSFSERIKAACQDIYKISDGRKNVAKAQENGLLNLPANFLEYDDIRNFMRHQFESLDEFELFMPKKHGDPEAKRIQRVTSYLKLCDKENKTIHQRMKSYIEVLHQMQGIMAEIVPNRLIRNRAESRNKFKKRVKEFAIDNPDIPVEVELNYLPMSREFYTLEKDLRKILPNIKIVDDVLNDESKFERLYNRMGAYKKRSDYLQSFHTLECSAMGHCIRHGINCKKEEKETSNKQFCCLMSDTEDSKKYKNLNIHDAFDYLQKSGIMDDKERAKWKYYTELRRRLSHYYFSDALKNEICNSEIEKEYNIDLRIMKERLLKFGPTVRKYWDDTYAYKNFDGRVVVLDHKNHKILHSIKFAPQKTAAPKEIDKTEPEKNVSQKTYNGVAKVKVSDGKMTGVKLPSGVYINLKNRGVDWGGGVRWYTNAGYFNALQTPKSTIRTNKELKVTSFFAGSNCISLENESNLLIDNRHNLLLDANGRMKEFDFNDGKNNIIKTEFGRTADGKDRILFDDGTSVLISGKDIFVSHNGTVLSKDNIKEFEATYNTQSVSLLSFNKHGNGR